MTKITNKTKSLIPLSKGEDLLWQTTSKEMEKPYVEDHPIIPVVLFFISFAIILTSFNLANGWVLLTLIFPWFLYAKYRYDLSLRIAAIEIPTKFVITSQRVFYAKKQNDRMSRPLKSVQKIKLNKPQILFCIEGLDDLVINVEEDYEKVVDLVKNEWYKQSPYAVTYNSYLDFAQKTGLKPELNIEKEYNCLFTGELNGLPCKFNIEKKQFAKYKSTVESSITCPNPNGLYFELKLEQGNIRFSKDAEIGDEQFDELFLIRTNNVSLLQEILDTATRQQLKKLFRGNHCIKFGERAKPSTTKKETIKDDITVLDLHLLEGTVSRENDYIDYDPDRKSSLTFDGEFNYSLKNMPSRLVAVYEIMERLAKKLVEQ